MLIDASEQDEKVYNEISKYLTTQYVVESFIPGRNNFFRYVYSEGDFKKMQNDKVLRNLLFDKKYNNSWYVRIIKATLDRSNELEELINQELNN